MNNVCDNDTMTGKYMRFKLWTFIIEDTVTLLVLLWRGGHFLYSFYKHISK